MASLGERGAVLFYDRLFEIAPSLEPLFRSDPKTQRIKFVAMLARGETLHPQGGGRRQRTAS